MYVNVGSLKMSYRVPTPTGKRWREVGDIEPVTQHLAAADLLGASEEGSSASRPWVTAGSWDAEKQL